MSTEMFQLIGFGVSGLGGLLAFIGVIWLVVLGFQKGGALWGILNLFCQPITGIIFCIQHKTGWIPLALIIIGNVLAGIGLIPILPSIMRELR